MPIRVPEKQDNKETIERTDVMLANDPPKVKSVIEESPITQKRES